MADRLAESLSNPTIQQSNNPTIPTVAVYLASPDEIDLSPAIAEMLAHGLSVVAPRWNGASYDLARLHPRLDIDPSAGGRARAPRGPRSPSSLNLRVGPMDILEPADADLVSPRDVALWLVPGLAFTRADARLGYGGGWYDRFLAAASPSARKLGIAYDFQIVPSLPCEAHDVSLDGLLTETAEV